MSDQNTKLDPSPFFHELMVQHYQNSLEITRRAGDRSEKALQQLVALITALASLAVVVFLSDSSTAVKTAIALISFAAMSVFGTLTYVWVLSAVFGLKAEMVVRLHLQHYFRDLDRVSYALYGRELVLDEYVGRLEDYRNPKGRAQWVDDVTLTLVGLVLFAALLAGMTAATGIYLVSDALARAEIFSSGLSDEGVWGLAVLGGLAVSGCWLWLLGWLWRKRHSALNKLLKKSEPLEKHH